MPFEENHRLINNPGFGSGNASRPARPVYIYVIQQTSDGKLKIGTSKNPKSRLVSLQTGNPIPLELVGYVLGSLSEEKAMHRRLAPWKVRQGKTEWFVPSPPVILEVDALLNREE